MTTDDGVTPVTPGPELPGVDLDTAYRELAPRVLGYLRAARTPDPENELGEVFLAVARHAHRFEGDREALRRWVFTIAHNRRVDAHRRRWRRPQVPLAEVPERGAVESGPEPPDPELIAALAGLADEQRTVVVLRFVADLPVADVAGILDRSQEAVKKLQARGLANLRRSLGHDTGTSG